VLSDDEKRTLSLMAESLALPEPVWLRIAISLADIVSIRLSIGFCSITSSWTRTCPGRRGLTFNRAIRPHRATYVSSDHDPFCRFRQYGSRIFGSSRCKKSRLARTRRCRILLLNG